MIGIIAALVILTAILALVHFSTRDKIPDGALMVNYGEKTVYIEMDTLAKIKINGTIVNGKGEQKEVDEIGVPLADILNAAGIDPAEVNVVTVSADDEFSAEISGEEIQEEGKAYLADDGEDGMRLIVFGDSDSKRNVRTVVKLDVE